MKNSFRTVIGTAALIAATVALGAPTKAPKRAAGVKPPTTEAVLIQSCDAHKFETTVQLTGPDGKTKQSKVLMCGVEGQSDADWIRTLKDAVKKTALNATMPHAAKEQIIAAVNAEIERLGNHGLQIPGGTDIGKLPKAAASKPAVPLSRDFDALPPLPTASNVAPPQLLGPGGVSGPILKLTLKCAVRGDEDRPTACETLDKDTVILVRADEAFPHGLDLRFIRSGNNRGDLALPALKLGQTAMLRLPPAVCAGVVRSRLEIQAVGANAPSGTAAGAIGEYDLRC